MRRELFFDHALLPSGWARDVRISIADGTILAVAEGAAKDGAERIAGIAIPGVPNLHCHAFQRGMAGLAELRGDSTDTFWTWRETMYRFALAMTPDDVAAVATLLYVEMLEQGFTRVGEFHYLHQDPAGFGFSSLRSSLQCSSRSLRALG